VNPAATPFVKIRVDHSELLNQHLRDALMEMSASTPSRATNAPGGGEVFQNKWLSHPHLHLQGPAVFGELGRAIEIVANKVTERKDMTRSLSIASMWGIISRSGMEGRRHNHGDLVSAIYYVDSGNSSDENGGLLQFYADVDKASPSHLVVPQTSLLIVFPSSLQHSVSRYSGADSRIMVSASLKLDEPKRQDLPTENQSTNRARSDD